MRWTSRRANSSAPTTAPPEWTDLLRRGDDRGTAGAAGHDGPERPLGRSPAVHFFRLIKNLTADGYYTSRIGLVDELVTGATRSSPAFRSAGALRHVQRATVQRCNVLCATCDGRRCYGLRDVRRATWPRATCHVLRAPGRSTSTVHLALLHVARDLVISYKHAEGGICDPRRRQPALAPGPGRRERQGSLSEVLDRLVSDARTAGRTDAAAIRSVRGTVDLPESDPELEGAEAYIRAQFDRSVRRPVVVKDPPARFAAKRNSRG